MRTPKSSPKRKSKTKKPKLRPLDTPMHIIAVSSRPVAELTIKHLRHVIDPYMSRTYALFPYYFSTEHLIQQMENKQPVLIIAIIDQPDDDELYSDLITKLHASVVFKNVPMISFPHLVPAPAPITHDKEGRVMKDLCGRKTLPPLFH